MPVVRISKLNSVCQERIYRARVRSVATRAGLDRERGGLSMADDGLYDDIEDISTREEPVAVSSAPLKDDESGVYVTTTDESQAPAGNDAAPVVEKAATNTAQNALTALYVGNLHWWVTDVQLQTMCEEYGKLRTPPRFFEDRVNGKSKVRHPPSHASLRSRRRPTRSPANPRPCAGLRDRGLH